MQGSSSINETPPTITIINPTEGYFHFSGIRLFPTLFKNNAETKGFGGFRVRPVQVQIQDDVDSPEDIQVYMYVKDNQQGPMTWNDQNNLFERKWTGPDLGVYTIHITATDSSNNTASAELDVWYFCFVPE